MQTCQDWLCHYDQHWAPNLDLNASGTKRGLQGPVYNRSRGYRMIFDRLLDKKSQDFQIIETGSTRKPDNWKDGNSGAIFADFVSRVGGFVRSVDIDPAAVTAANIHIDNRWHRATCQDSVSWLQEQPDLDSVDLFYLDSWDVHWEDDRPSAEHHLREFLVIENYLRPGTIVAIDDNARLLDGQRSGKGRRIVEHLSAQGKHPIYDDYQIIFTF